MTGFFCVSVDVSATMHGGSANPRHNDWRVRQALWRKCGGL